MESVQKDINATMRGILVDWLVEVAEEYKLNADTLFLSVLYIDRCLSVHTVARTQLQVRLRPPLPPQKSKQRRTNTLIRPNQTKPNPTRTFSFVYFTSPPLRRGWRLPRRCDDQQ